MGVATGRSPSRPRKTIPFPSSPIFQARKKVRRKLALTDPERIIA